jgi:hypothetical protein
MVARKLLPILLLVAGCSLSSVRGSGNVITQPRQVAGFTAVSLSGSGLLIIEQSGTESLSISADDNLMQYLTSEVDGGELELGTTPGTSVSPSKEITYRVTLRKLDGLELSGSATAQVRGVATDRLEVSISGSGEVTIAGRADSQEISISGSGEYRGAELTSKAAEIDISGSGNAELAVSDKLDVDVSGSGSVDYIGHPAIKQSVSGSGEIRQRSAGAR